MKARNSGDGRILFHCPGCESAHMVDETWEFNGNFEQPTFKPSVLVNGMPEYFNPTSPRCHSYVTDGKIEFMMDSTHTLAGQTVELPELPKYLQ